MSIPNFTNQKIKERYHVQKKLYGNDKTLVYDVIDLENPTAKLVVKMKLKNFARA